MKKESIIIILCLALILPFSAMSQGFFIKVGGGFGYGISPLETQIPDIQGDTTGALTHSNRNLTMGTGGKGGLDFGYMITKYIGVQVGAEFFQGTKVTAVEVRDQAMIFGGTYIGSGNVDADAKITMIRLKASIIVAGGPDRIKVFGRVGILSPVWGYTTVSRNSSFTPASGPVGTSYQETKTYGRFGIGYAGAVGVKVKLTKLISVFGEIEMNLLNINNKSQTMTVYEENGSDELNNQTEYQREIIYHDELGPKSNNPLYSSNGSFNPDAAMDELTYKSSSSQVAINVGLMFTIGWRSK